MSMLSFRICRCVDIMLSYCHKCRKKKNECHKKEQITKKYTYKYITTRACLEYHCQVIRSTLIISEPKSLAIRIKNSHKKVPAF